MKKITYHACIYRLTFHPSFLFLGLAPPASGGEPSRSQLPRPHDADDARANVEGGVAWRWKGTEEQGNAMGRATWTM